MTSANHNMQALPLFQPIFSEFSKATEFELHELETVLGRPLPDQAATFLRSYGSAGFAGEASVVAVDGTSCGVFTIFRATGPKGSVVGDLIAHPDYVADGLLPIADDLFNNRYVVDLATGTVRFIEYVAGRRRELEIAGSFDAFLMAIRVVLD